MAIIEIRCPNERAHYNAKGVKYELCAHILGGLNDENSDQQVFHCSQCGQFFEVSYDGFLTIKKIPKGQRVDLHRNWRQVI